MPYFNKELNELVYNAAESEPFDCPVCGVQSMTRNIGYTK